MGRTPPSQIALPLPARRPAEPPRIVVGRGNAAVIEALRAPESWPFHVAVLTGPPRSGKSLLARWAQRQARGRLEVIDNAETHEETALFHRWNAVQQGGRGKGAGLLLVVNSGKEGGGWQIALPDLASRIGGSLWLEIGAPDDAMAAELILAHAEQRGLVLPEGAGPYLAARATRSYAAIEELVAMIDRISLERQTPPTMSVWRAALEALYGPEQGRLF